MLDYIIKFLFTKETKRQCLTIKRTKNNLNYENVFLRKKETSDLESYTCLSKYFKGLKGLNLKEREECKI